jgi:hypothetical protein
MNELVRCWLEADRADDIAAALYGIQRRANAQIERDIRDVRRQIQDSSRLLRDLFDLVPFYSRRLPYVLDLLQVVQPCIARSLDDIRYHVRNNREYTRERIWHNIRDDFRNQHPNVTLRDRFVLYNEFWIQLIQLLSRSEMPLVLRLVRGLLGQQTIDVQFPRSGRGVDKHLAITPGTTHDR